MSERENDFPQTIVLNGIDYFLLQLDRIMLRSSGKRNICTFVVELTGHLERHVLQRQLSDLPAYRWITGLRIHYRFPFSLVSWKVDANAPVPEITEHLCDHDGILEILQAFSLDGEKHAPFKIDLLQTKHCSLLVFSWHHALMDAHGGERFVRFLGTQPVLQQPLWVNENIQPLPLHQRASVAYQMKKFVYETSELPLLTLYKPKSVKPGLRYRVLCFSEQESGLISQRAQRHGAGFLLSAFYLAVTACAIARIQRQRHSLPGDVLVPVPQDRRRRGAPGPLFGNQVTFLFYRIPQAVLSDLQNCTAWLVKQMTALMRSEKPGNYLLMMDFLRRVPGPLYRYLLKSPTSGLLGSFFYSDTGDSLQDFGRLFGLPVRGAVHYPPNVYPPGLTFVFTRFHGILQITISYMEEVLDAKEAGQMITYLRCGLLGEADNSGDDL